MIFFNSQHKIVWTLPEAHPFMAQTSRELLVRTPFTLKVDPGNGRTVLKDGRIVLSRK